MRPLLPLMLLLAAAAPRVSNAAQSYTVRGCGCYGACERTIDSPFTAWCTTSPYGADEATYINTTYYCASAAYSRTRAAFWDNCIQNITGVPYSEKVYLTTFGGMWATMTLSAVVASASAYFLMGCAASLLTSPRKTVWWLPWSSAVVGAAQGFFLGGTIAVCLSFLYLTMPYAIERSVAVGLGLGVAVIASYSALGRTHGRKKFAHGSEVS